MPSRFHLVQSSPNTFFLGGELDIAAEPVVVDAVGPATRSGGLILLDLSAVTFLDSTGIRSLVSVSRSLGDGGCLLLHGAQEGVQRVIDLVGIGELGNVHVQRCERAAFPRLHQEWTPSPDLYDRVESLRHHVPPPAA